jgi:hypothetical protein
LCRRERRREAEFGFRRAAANFRPAEAFKSLPTGLWVSTEIRPKFLRRDIDVYANVNNLG